MIWTSSGRDHILAGPTLNGRRSAPRTPLKFSILGFGAAGIGNLYTAVDDEAAEAAVAEAFRRGIRYFDTAPYYGYGLSEIRLGRTLSSMYADDVLISTKVGRLIVSTQDGAEVSPDGFAVSGRR